MTYEEQHRMIDELRLHVRSMTGKERYDFEMMQKRDKDDEQLDDLTAKQLAALHAAYHPQRSRASIEDAWKKLAGGKKPEGE